MFYTGEQIEGQEVFTNTAVIDCDILLYKVMYTIPEDASMSVIQDRLATMVDDIAYGAKAKDIIAVLSGTDNFRYDVAVTKEYKGNRKPKPMLFYKVKCALLGMYDVVVARGEADDYICSIKDDSSMVGCSIDKDFLGTPGLNYNWDKDTEPRLVGDREAMDFFLTQWITGDSTDSIGGVPRKGIKCKEAQEISSSPCSHNFKTILGMYPSLQAAQENMKLLWIQHKGQSYNDLLGMGLADLEDICETIDKRDTP